MTMAIIVSKTTWVDSVVQLISVLLVFVFVLVLAYFAARIAGKFQTNINKNSNIKVIESFRVSNNKMIEIVKIGNKYLAIGLGKDNIELLAELDEDSIKEQSPNLMENVSFKEILAQLKMNNNLKK